MSNRRKPRRINRGSGKLQRDPLLWRTGAANPGAMKEQKRLEEESRKPKFILQPKGT